MNNLVQFEVSRELSLTLNHHGHELVMVANADGRLRIGSKSLSKPINLIPLSDEVRVDLDTHTKKEKKFLGKTFEMDRFDLIQVTDLITQKKVGSNYHLPFNYKGRIDFEIDELDDRLSELLKGPLYGHKLHKRPRVDIEVFKRNIRLFPNRILHLANIKLCGKSLVMHRRSQRPFAAMDNRKHLTRIEAEFYYELDTFESNAYTLNFKDELEAIPTYKFLFKTEAAYKEFEEEAKHLLKEIAPKGENVKPVIQVLRGKDKKSQDVETVEHKQSQEEIAEKEISCLLKEAQELKEKRTPDYKKMAEVIKSLIISSEMETKLPGARDSEYLKDYVRSKDFKDLCETLAIQFAINPMDLINRKTRSHVRRLIIALQKGVKRMRHYAQPYAHRTDVYTKQLNTTLMKLCEAYMMYELFKYRDRNRGYE